MSGRPSAGATGKRPVSRTRSTCAWARRWIRWPSLTADPAELGTYDFAYIDADKQNNPNYIELCLKLLRPGGVISIDNIFAEGTHHRRQRAG